MTTKIIINGANGRMGKITSDFIEAQSEFKLVGRLSKTNNLAKSIHDSSADVVIDFTLPHCVFENSKAIIESGAHPIIGTSGLSPDQIAELQKLCADKQLGGIIAPNFSIGTILMMQFSKQTAKYFPSAEIIEYHHDKKVDAPSGTAIKTAELIYDANNKVNNDIDNNVQRGEKHQGVPIHSVRLPNYFASQEVVFSNQHERLTINSECLSRESMMAGVKLSLEKVMALDRLVYGLDQLLD